MIILTTKYCYVIIDIAPKGRLHLLIVARNGVGPTVDALGPGIRDGVSGCRYWDETTLRNMGYDSLCVLCPGDVSSPEFVLMNNGHPNAQKLLRVGVADDAGDVYSWENL